MKSNQAVKAIMEKKGVRFTDLFGRLGIKSNVLGQRLSRDNWQVDKLAETLRAMDYKLVAVPRDATKVSEGIVIE